ncbi:hypothetical protein Pelo_18275 [Pelomyxa schiedti]|nr:hypothetical protein Pelo_18275 [Pelomyxa schiedti]
MAGAVANTQYQLRCDGDGTLTLETCGSGGGTQVHWYDSSDCDTEVAHATSGCADGSAILLNQPVIGGNDYVWVVEGAAVMIVMMTGGGSCTTLVSPSPECIARKG